MAEDLIRYDVLAQEALRGVVRKVLLEAQRAGLPGEHHFYITFNTRAPGVRLSSRLLERYPEEMTIVVQHQFWDLEVTEHSFEIGLAFSGVPENLLVPFTSIKSFVDPSVEFGLQFDTTELVADEPSKTDDDSEPEVSSSTALGAPAPVSVVPIDAKDGDVSEAAKASKDTNTNDDDDSDSPDDGPNSGADVVSLDAFRKK